MAAVIIKYFFSSINITFHRFLGVAVNELWAVCHWLVATLAISGVGKMIKVVGLSQFFLCFFSSPHVGEKRILF